MGGSVYCAILFKKLGDKMCVAASLAGGYLTVRIAQGLGQLAQVHLKQQ